MQVFEMVVLLAAIVVVGRIVREWLRQRGHAPAAEDPRLARLEARVRALEEVVTDGNQDLKRKFADLERDAA